MTIVAGPVSLLILALVGAMVLGLRRCRQGRGFFMGDRQAFWTGLLVAFLIGVAGKSLGFGWLPTTVVGALAAVLVASLHSGGRANGG